MKKVKERKGKKLFLKLMSGYYTYEMNIFSLMICKFSGIFYYFLWVYVFLCRKWKLKRRIEVKS